MADEGESVVVKSQAIVLAQNVNNAYVGRKSDAELSRLLSIQAITRASGIIAASTMSRVSGDAGK